LERRISRGGNVTVEEAVLKHGRPFIAIGRPTGYRLGRVKQCYANAGKAACAEKGIYVEGFAMDSKRFFPHAWITLDGIHAIDLTLRDPVNNFFYFGIPFCVDVLEEWRARRGNRGRLLDAMDDDLDQMLSDAAHFSPTFESAEGNSSL
jgi:hypothetical protein